MYKKLYRSTSDKWLGGVCAGVAKYFNIDPLVVRILMLVAVFGYGCGLLLYIIGWILIPQEPTGKIESK